MLPAHLPEHPDSILQQSLAYMQAAGKITMSTIEKLVPLGGTSNF